VLSDNAESKRHEVLLNIDPAADAAALRHGDLKLVTAARGTTRHCAGWYPVDELARNPCKDGCMVDVPGEGLERYSVGRLNVTVVRDAFQPATLHFVAYRRARGESTNNGRQRAPHLNEVARPRRSEVASLLGKIGRKPPPQQQQQGSDLQRPLVVGCGRRPANASTNCRPWIAACLYNVTEDPCEYHNLAPDRPDQVASLQKRLRWYKEKAVPPLNQPVDDAGLPYHHHWNWVPWRKSGSGK